MATAATTIALATHAASARVLLADCGSSSFGGRVAPRDWDYGCTEVLDLVGARWRHWGSAHARATGKHQLDNCRPNCGAGTVRSYRAHATAWHVRRCRDSHRRSRRFYTRVTLLYLVPTRN